MHKNIYHGFRIIIVIVIFATVYGCEDYDDNPEVLPRLTFHSPSNDKLTEKQIIDYIVIRRKIIRFVNSQKTEQTLSGKARQEKAMSPAGIEGDSKNNADVRNFDEIEEEAANSLNMSYEEYLWVKDVVISTQTKMLVQQYYDLNNRIITLLEETLLDYKEKNANGNDHQKKSTMDGYVVEMRQEMNKLHRTTAETGEGAEALQHNIIIVTKYIGDLESMEKKALQPFAIEQ